MPNPMTFTIRISRRSYSTYRSSRIMYLTAHVTGSRERVWEHSLDRGKFGELAQSLSNVSSFVPELMTSYLCLVIDAKPLYL